MIKALYAVCLFIALPLSVHALTADELREQINALLTQIQAVQAQISAQGGGAVQPVIPAAAGSCPRVSRVLKLGDSGADVTRLQQFLAADPAIYPERNISGYYGPLTEAAVKRFQCKNKIVCDGDAASTGYGVTGPRTAAILALQCPDGGGAPLPSTSGGTGQVSGFIKVTPTTGASPLNVTVEATVNTAHTCAAATYFVDYGDGTAPASVSVPQNACNEVRQVFAHVYTVPGTYAVLLRSGTHQVSATVVVQQGTTLPIASDTISGSPTTGATPLTVSFSGLVNVSATCNAGPYSINFGDGQTASIAVAGCSATSFTVPHTYSTSGVYTARLYRGSVGVGSIAINAGGSVSSSGGAFSVSGGINGNPLQARTTFDLPASCSAYELDWGDGTTRSTQSGNGCSSSGSVQKELTHTYTNPGAYTVTLRRGSSLNSVDTAAITIVQ